MKRAMTLLAGSAALSLVAMRAAALRSVTDDDELDTGEHTQKTQFAPLCAEEIVANTCGALNGDHGGSTYTDDVWLVEALAATKENIGLFWEVLDLPTDMASSEPEGTYKVQCITMCLKVKQHLEELGSCPPSSDVACYTDEDGSEQCDLDLSPESISHATRFEGDIPDFRDENELEESKRNAPKGRMLKRADIDYSDIQVLVRRVANLFRIYPKPQYEHEFDEFEDEFDEDEDYDDEDADGNEYADEDGQHGAFVQGAIADGAVMGSNASTCKADCRNDECDYDECFDCSFCTQVLSSPEVFSATTAAPAISMKCEWDCVAGDCHHDECSECSFCNLPSEVITTKAPATNNACEWDCVQGDCHHEECSGCSFCPDPTLPPKVVTTTAKAPATGGQGGRPISYPPRFGPANKPGQTKPGLSGWRADVQKRSLEAQAYMNTAIAKFQQHKTGKFMKTWFGPSSFEDQKARKKVQKTLNSVINMLGNVEFVFPGSECKPRTYAYVYPSGSKTKNKRGQYIFYLCQTYMDAPRSEQIETIVHEGSHHAVAYLDDVKFQGETAYGRDTCKALARSSMKKALNNADSFCYYIQDITDVGV